MPAELSEDERRARIASAIAAVESLAPKDELEGLLAAQMIAVHNAAMDCLRRAVIPGQLPQARNENLKHATNFMRTYAQQMAALDKHRGRGQQNIIIKHFHLGSDAPAGLKDGIPGSRTKGRRDQIESTALPYAADQNSTIDGEVASPRKKN